MSSERQQLQAAIAALESQRTSLGDAVVDLSVAPLRARLRALAIAAGEEAPPQALRQVSILFLDVVGSTSLSQHLDPEAIHELMDGALARCTRIVQAHNGKVLQYAGDSLLAAFGADVVLEDDPERAVRCGLALLAEGRSVGLEVQRNYRQSGFDFRVGIHTGSVLLGGGVDAEGTIRGIAVNIAARMEQTAPPGRLRITQDTYTQVRGAFDVEALEAVSVKGVDAPVRSYVVLRARSRSFEAVSRGIEGIETTMVGRNVEMAALQEAYRHVCSDRVLAAVTVVAEAGVGKSRLLKEFERWLERQTSVPHLFVGRAQPHTQSQPLGLLRDLLAWRFQIADDDSLESASAKFMQGVTSIFGMTQEGNASMLADVQVLGHLIGLDYSESSAISGIRDDARQIRQRGFFTAAQLLRRLAARDGRPVLLALEDVHWADDASLDFLAYVMHADRDVPLLLLALARPAMFEHLNDWLEGVENHRRIELRPLDSVDSQVMADELLKKLPEVPVALRDMVTRAAEGNPFYMEELVKMLVDRGAIEASPERWTLHEDSLSLTEVPPTLTGVLQARLDQLPAVERKALQEASVIGPVFWDQALAVLNDRADKVLPELVRRQLALPHDVAALDGLREYAFQHHLLHQVTYETVLRRVRRELHAKVAHWFAGQSGGRVGEFLGQIAEHYEKAGDAANGAEYHARAAEYARERLAHVAVHDHVRRALDLLGQAPPALDFGMLRWRLLQVRERTWDLQGRRTEQRADQDAMAALAESMNDDAKRAHVAQRRGDMAMRLANWIECECAAREAMAYAEGVGDHEQRLLAQFTLTQALSATSRIEESQLLAESGLAEARARGLKFQEGAFLNSLGFVASVRGDLMACQALNELAIVVFRETGNRRGELVTLANIGAFWLSVGDLATASTALSDAHELARTNEDRAIECALLSSLSRLAALRGDHSDAARLARAALESAIETGARESEITALLRLGDAQLAQDQIAAAAHAFGRAAHLATQIGDATRLDAEAGMARTALARGTVEDGIPYVESILAHLASGAALDGTDDQRLIELTCIRTLEESRDPRAEELLERSYAGIQAAAAALGNESMRRSFLSNIPHHRQIIAARSATRAGADPAG